MKKILVGYDESEAAERALERAGELAAALGAEVVVVSVAPAMIAGPRGGAGIDPTDLPEQHRAEADRAQAALAARGVTARAVVGMGDPAEVILEAAKEQGADLIVVGTREPNLLTRFFGGSVSGEVARHASCDVLIVH